MSERSRGRASAPLRISFVCTGNICRSPLAEALARHHLQADGLAGRVEVDSFGTHDYHVGDGADRRTIATAAGFGIDLARHRARQASAHALRDADLVFAMDDSHHAFLRRLLPPSQHATLHRFLPWIEPGAAVQEVPDPYYGDQAGFVAVHRLLDEATQRLTERVANLVATRRHD